LALLRELRKRYQGFVLLEEKPGKYLAGAVNVGISVAIIVAVGSGVIVDGRLAGADRCGTVPRATSIAV
jgi:hypothetical protein